MIKNFNYGERFHMQFRWEMFNALNQPSYGQPNNNPTRVAGQPYDPTNANDVGSFGQITGIGPVPPRVMQAALKITF